MCGGVVAYVYGREGGPCEVQVGMRGLQVSWARLMVAFMGCIVECFSQCEGVAGRVGVYLPVLAAWSAGFGCGCCVWVGSAVSIWGFAESDTCSWSASCLSAGRSVMECLCLWKGGGSERGRGSWGRLVDMGWDKEFRVVLFMALMGVRGCSGSLGLGVGEGR